MSVNTDAALVFHANPGRGPTLALDGEMRALRACKRACPVQVQFADRIQSITTLEGMVPAMVGDAIVTGVLGERWPVTRAAFAAKYQPVAPLPMGAPGIYLSLPLDALAARIHQPFAVVLAEGHARLTGQPGDWLVDYGNGHLGIVHAAVFDATYDLLEPS